MKAIHFDGRTFRELPACDMGRSGFAGFISWQRFFRENNELRPGERLQSFQVDDRGITFRVSS